MRKQRIQFWALLLLFQVAALLSAQAQVTHMVYTSDTHYGISKDFRGKSNVSSRKINQAMIEMMNTLPEQVIPSDNGIGAGEEIKSIEAVINTGDITNRMQKGVQSAKESWKEFNEDWSTLLSLRNSEGEKSPQYLSAGNHEASNAIGLYKIVLPTDPTPMVEIYNRMMKPSTPLTTATFDYKRHKIHYSVSIGGVRLLFVALWPDSKEREWIQGEIERIGTEEPILLFSHDAPKVEVKHLLSPDGNSPTSGKDKFEGILSDISSVGSTSEYPTKEAFELADFLRSQPTIKAYFHGDDNHSEFYMFRSPDGKDVIPTFRVDSPMKGNYSKKDSSKLSFMLISIDQQAQKLTAREVLWNQREQIVWGESCTISLR